MNKKTIKLGILLVFIFSCNVSTSNNNVDVKPTTSVSSTTSVLPTVTPSVQITTIPTNNTNPFTFNNLPLLRVLLIQYQVQQ
jgi:hypothetical protein